jgi:hypothetical protein
VSKKISNPPPPPGRFKPPPPTEPPPRRADVTVLITDATVSTDQLEAFDAAGNPGPGTTSAMAFAKVKELSSKLPAWRNAEADPPHERGRVLGYWPGAYHTVGGPVDVIFYAPEAKQPWGGNSGIRPPTHWMPLPEPPKEKP